MASNYGQAAYSVQPGTGSRRRRGRPRTGRATAVTVLVLGVAGLGVSLAGVAIQMMPRQFTARQEQQILDWEEARRWRVLPAGKIFPAVVHYQPSSLLAGGSLSLTASRVGLASQASCRAATDSAVATVLARNGCKAVLRATYVDGTDSYVVTVGVAAFPGTAQAAAAEGELEAKGGAVEGVRAVKFNGTPAAWFTDTQRQMSLHQRAATYVIFSTIGYADERPWVRVKSDPYVSAEMTSLGAGVADVVQSVLAAPLPLPHCPGTAGC